MIDGKNIFDQPIKNDLKTYQNIRKISEHKIRPNDVAGM